MAVQSLLIPGMFYFSGERGRQKLFIEELGWDTAHIRDPVMMAQSIKNQFFYLIIFVREVAKTLLMRPKSYLAQDPESFIFRYWPSVMELQLRQINLQELNTASLQNQAKLTTDSWTEKNYRHCEGLREYSQIIRYGVKYSLELVSKLKTVKILEGCFLASLFTNIPTTIMGILNKFVSSILIL